MPIKKHIEENLKHLDQSYRGETNPKRALYFSKLAILELCGWIEISMDEIITNYCDKKVIALPNKKIVADIVKTTYGFEYEKHFRKMLLSLIGVVAFERLEASVNVSIATKFKSHLVTLKNIRDRLAHTYIKGAPGINSLDAPSVTLSRLREIYDGLNEFKKQLNALR